MAVSDEIVRAINKMLEPVRRRVSLMVGRAVLTLVNDLTTVQSVQGTLLFGELSDAMERFQEYGFTSVPLPGAEAIALFVGGEREHGIVIATEDRKFRMKLLPGEVAIYDNKGQFVKLGTAGIEILSAVKTTVTAPVVDVKGGTVNLGVAATEALIKGNTFQTLFNAHTHTSFGVPTTPPNTPLVGTELSATCKVSP